VSTQLLVTVTFVYYERFQYMVVVNLGFVDIVILIFLCYLKKE